MTRRNSRHNSQSKNDGQGRKGGMARVAPIAAGVAAGAAVGAAAAVALSNRDTRKAIGQRLDDLKDIALDTIDEVQRQAVTQRDKMQNAMSTQKTQRGSRKSKITH